MNEITVTSPAGHYLQAGYLSGVAALVMWSASTALLHQRAREWTTLVMLLATVLTCVALTVVAFAPDVEDAGLGEVVTDASGRPISSDYYFRSPDLLFWPAWLTAAASVLVWSIAFSVHAWRLIPRSAGTPRPMSGRA